MCTLPGIILLPHYCVGWEVMDETHPHFSIPLVSYNHNTSSYIISHLSVSLTLKSPLEIRNMERLGTIDLTPFCHTCHTATPSPFPCHFYEFAGSLQAGQFGQCHRQLLPVLLAFSTRNFKAGAGLFGDGGEWRQGRQGRQGAGGGGWFWSFA